MQVLFDRGPLGGATAFRAPIELIRADQPEQVPAAMEALRKAQEDGKWLAGYASYELGFMFSHKLRWLMPVLRDCPLMLFGVFDAAEPWMETGPAGQATLERPQPLWDFAQYSEAFDQLQAHIAAGDLYQGNLTFPMRSAFSGSLEALYQRLAARQPVRHGALVDLGGPAILSRSPELFFRCDAEGRLTTRPMKGTAPRGATPEEDAANAAWLRASEKNQAENLMIVDLLRNDVSRISEIGSVKVPELFAVESYATVHQMTSRITSQLREGVTFPDILEALFPCGSVTGAPKIMAMTLLRKLEERARNVYCGAVGWVAPDGRMEFNVAIRTLTCWPDGRVDLNVGGGIVHDSRAQEEYDEALLKSRFAWLD
ncbi:aminodeoxychorismate synthase component I [Aliiruegeria sabulilitoris]|uniref:aminodeoxychorismate synthase component I n=1 Tax=Aliiruegeria sabulilitoris TaxID=1510458 RepID=UPI00082C5C72|nr:aminodeoxychorismate synthase component I [Aliiruegeria sabulilitoris]NDR59623.1 aminodeoxychorismate synthase component I [Pseudoruegeria sp. M32A2M]